MGNVISKYRHPKENAWIEDYPFSDAPPDLSGSFLYRSEEEREADRDGHQATRDKSEFRKDI